MINAGSSCLFCPYPVNLNMYTGCSHACKYCYASKQKDITKIAPLRCEKEVNDFCHGKRHKIVDWADWNIPLHIGTDCDPLQPCESEYKETYKILKILQANKYPYIITTKGRLAAEEPYISIFADSVCIVQISAACSAYDEMETGAPSFKERLEMVKKLSDRGVRVIVRAEPFIIRYEKDILASVKDIAEAGAFAIKCGGYMAKSYHNGMYKFAGSWLYKKEILAKSYYKIREECHKYGLKFYCNEHSLKHVLGDSYLCCGTEGMEDIFIPNKYRADAIFEGENPEPTNGMKRKGSAYLFRQANQNTVFGNMVTRMSFEEYIKLFVSEWREDYFTDKRKEINAIAHKKQ